MMREIKDKRIEKEIQLLNESTYVIKNKKIAKEEFHLRVEIPIQLDEEVTLTFLIHITNNFPMIQPRIFCETNFCYPNLCDGRDLLDDIVGESWSPKMRLIDVINKIPNFIKEFYTNLKNGCFFLIGNYYLGDKYDLSILETLPIYLSKVKEKLFIDGKEKEFLRILMISDMFFCLFDQERWTKNNLKLIFWSNIRSLITIKKLIKSNVCRFYWKQRIKKKPYEMVLDIENCNDVVEIMLEKMSKFGINYKISKNVLGARSGSIPKTDIDTVENAIKELESQIDNDPDMAAIEYLMDLYSKAIEYYSATNNPRYEYYKEKIHNTLSTPRITDYLETETYVKKEENEIEKINNRIENKGSLDIIDDNEVKEIPVKNCEDIDKKESTIDNIIEINNTQEGVKIELSNDDEKVEFDDDEDIDDE